MIIDQFWSVRDPSEWKISQILAKIVKNLAEIPKILPETTEMVLPHPKSLWIVEDSRNKYARMIFGQFYGFCNPTEWKIGHILVKIVKKLAETPKILPKATQMVPVYPNIITAVRSWR